MKETWRRHPEHADYDVSDMGLVRRMKPKKGAVVGRVLRATRMPSGYRTVSLDGRRRLVHQLVLETFVGPRPEGCEVRHLNDVKGDDRLDNLCWGTHAENYADRVAHGGGNHGSRHGMAKLTEADVIAIRRLRRMTGEACWRIGEAFGVADETVRLIVNRVSWRHVA